jgi:hypothetical protein
MGMSVVPAIEYELAVDQDIPDPHAVAEWIEVGGPVDDLVRVDDCDIGEQAGPEEASIDQPGLGGVERGHLAHGVLQPQ